MLVCTLPSPNHTLSLLDKVESAWQDALTSLEQEAGFKALQTSERGGCWYVHCHRQRAYAWLRIDEFHDIHYVLF
jgi:hypothetical protein